MRVFRSCGKMRDQVVAKQNKQSRNQVANGYVNPCARSCHAAPCTSLFESHAHMQRESSNAARGWGAKHRASKQEKCFIVYDKWLCESIYQSDMQVHRKSLFEYNAHMHRELSCAVRAWEIKPLQSSRRKCSITYSQMAMWIRLLNLTRKRTPKRCLNIMPTCKGSPQTLQIGQPIMETREFDRGMSSHIVTTFDDGFDFSLARSSVLERSSNSELSSV